MTNPNTCKFPKNRIQDFKHAMFALTESILYRRSVHILTDFKTEAPQKHSCLLIELSRRNTENHFRCHFYSSLHIHTKTNPHKVSNITQRYLQKCSYQGPCVEYSQRTPCLLHLISGLFSAGECLVEGDEWSCRGVSVVLCMGTGASCDWTLSGGVSRRAGLQAHQECSRLISCKGALDPQKEKQMSL